MKFFQVLLIASVGIILASGRATQQEEKRLIKTSEEKPGEWMSQEEIAGLIRKGTTFVDITDSKYPAVNPESIRATVDPPTALKHQPVVNSIIEKVNMVRVQEFVKEFSTYHTRYYASATGRASQQWLFSQIQAIDTTGYTETTVTREEINHGYLQRSIRVRIEGRDPTLKNEVVIFGAHQDSVNKHGPSLRSPGSDDNASGSSVGLETLRTIIENKTYFKRTVEFHWYAAEEIGLRGSKAIADQYKEDKVNVVAMLNMDVVGHYVPGVEDIGVFTDNGNAKLQQFLRILTDEYLTFGRRDRTCGYGCSDHASWTQAGFPAVMASEVVPHVSMHTPNDRIENMDFKQVHEFVKLAIGFVVEMSEPDTPANPNP